MKPSELLREVKGRLKSGPNTWGKGNRAYKKPPFCILGHFNQIGLDSGAPYDMDPGEVSAFGAIKTALGHPEFDIIRWNDDPKTTLWDVLSVLGKAQRKLEEQGL